VYKRPSSAPKWKTPKKEDWHIKKKMDAPDMGTYDAVTSKRNVMRAQMAVVMSKSNIPTFTAMMSKVKAWCPPAGTYNPEKCYSFVSRPNMKRRV
jgi:hypothetical protein